MKMVFRWYGPGDSIPLTYIRQIPGMTGVVTAVYDVPVGEVWQTERILALRDACRAAGLEMEVIESVPVHEDIKLGRPSRDRYIENYAATIENLGRAGVRCICYNFMPVFDWLRTNLHTPLADGSNALSYCHEELMGLDPHCLHLPGWDESYTQSQLDTLLGAYAGMSHGELFDNLVYFLRGIMPACDRAGVNMAIHPDDPPWDMFGLPRIITGADSYARLFAAVPDIHNGITLCTGSLGADRGNDLPALAASLAPRTYFAHLRQIKFTGGENAPRDFCESGHRTEDGSLDMYAIVRALCENGFDSYVRPDHGRNIWGEDGKPGYGLYDRALAACGARVALLDINAEAAEAVAASIGENAVSIPTDCLSKADIQSAADTVHEKLGKVSILINGAGGNNPRATCDNEVMTSDVPDSVKSFFDLDESGLKFVFDLNITSAFLVTQVFAQDMIGEGGNILNISSMNAFRPLTKIPAYSAAKAGVSNFTEWLAVHFAPCGIRVNAIAPGFFVTNQNRSLLYTADGQPTARTGKILAATPQGRFGKVEDLLGTLLWLMSDEASGFVTGVVVPVDGGFNAYSGV